jgi:phosphoenolpyruvate synthase/pyruvate phosphate dikinase
MEKPVLWLPDATGTPWEALGEARRSGLPVPDGYVVHASVQEKQIREAYAELTIRERTHFLAVRGPVHALLNVIGPDALIHTLRRLWTESPDAPVLIQRMVHSMWCGKANWHRKNLRIKANEGMLLLDPDTYLVSSATRKCLKRTLEAKQRKMIRHVDGTAKVVTHEGEREPMPAELLTKIVELAVRVDRDIGWAVDDSDRVWLLSILVT